jgi:nucleotide-binding universal stress UspA family protein
MEGGMDYGIDVMPGFPWMMILKTARKQRADLVVMGPHSSRAKEMGVMRVTSHAGSTVQKVIQHERCPVMLVNDNATEDALAFKKILVSTDFSKSCESALAFAVELAREKGSKLVVFHMNSGWAASRGEDATVAMERFCAGIPAEVAHEVQICKGESPQKEILKFMNQVAADLIVMGSHTKEKNGKWYIGSAVEEVSLRAPCSVCIITDPKVLLRFQRD